MTARNYSSTAEAKTLSTAINDNETTIILNTISTLPSTYPYTIVIDADTPSEEIVTVVASAGGNSLTVVRGQDTTTAIAHDPGAVVKHMITPRDLREPQRHIEASGPYEIQNNGQDPAVTTSNIIKPVHGIGVDEGNVVGTAKTQTLTNKIISLSNNTVTGTTAQFNTALTDGNFATIAGTETLTNKTLTSPTFTGVSTSGPGLVPVGTVISTALADTVAGWLLCDGSNVSRTTYAGLFTAIGTTYGSGDGSSTFGIPNLKGRIPVGKDTSQTEFDTLGETGGSKTHTHTNSSTGTAGAHTHEIDPPSTSTSSDSHSHTAPAHTHTGPSHTHTGPGHTHTGANHTHDTNIGEGDTGSAGTHSHTDTTSGASSSFSFSFQGGSSGTGAIPQSGHTHSVATTSNGSHTHTFNPATTTSTSAGDGTTSSSGTGATGASGTAATGSAGEAATTSNSHGHTVDIASFTSGAVSVEHLHTIADTGSTSNLSPYIVLNYLIKH
jgi:microcystin-dependent protein